MANKKQSGLGRGIEALFEENNLDDLTAQESVQDIELTKIRPNPYQPRRTFDQKALKEPLLLRSRAFSNRLFCGNPIQSWNGMN